MRHVPIAFAALAAAACTPAPPGVRGVERDETLLTVSATGRSETRPDEARFWLGVETIAANAREASRLNNEKMQRVAAALEGFKVGRDDMQTENLALGRIDYGKDRGRFRAYNTVEVRLRDMARVSEAITAATESGANLMRGPALSVSDREAASRSAYAMAFKAARSRADAYAEAAGLEVARVLTIRDNGEGGYSPPPISMDASETMAVQMSAAPAAPPPPPASFNPGVNRATVSVSVAFALREK
ncbi:SIMPL domain-containing protein [Sphingomonas mesophila]|uniref:SIMPL domain-containing protein n=1 Tax=Sphingomonas mesophila TaxID=2303576 RepID=UPI000E58237E|nr:SIMPL domain-containing protein [Sphingomonas mesophila]